MVCATSKGSNQPAHTQSDKSLCKSLEYSMNVQLLAKHHLESLSLKGGCTGWSESTFVKMPYVTAHLLSNRFLDNLTDKVVRNKGIKSLAKLSSLHAV